MIGNTFHNAILFLGTSTIFDTIKLILTIIASNGSFEFFFIFILNLSERKLELK